MTQYVGGPETDKAVEARQLRYVRMWGTGEARMFAIIESGNDADEGLSEAWDGGSPRGATSPSTRRDGA
ncbi:hypothetical protein [Demequina lutea]|nr:hypothetical protein [Demequina lutea]